jgi:hypothetical protein
VLDTRLQEVGNWGTISEKGNELNRTYLIHAGPSEGNTGDRVDYRKLLIRKIIFLNGGQWRIPPENGQGTFCFLP